MSERAKIKSYIKVLELLEGKKNVTLKVIKKNLKNDGLPSSERTIQRIIEELRNEFDVAIEYNKEKKMLRNFRRHELLS